MQTRSASFLPARAARAALIALAGLALLASCGRDDPNDKIAVSHDAQPRNTQAEARALFDGLCATRNFGEAECACMRDRMLRTGTRAMAFVGASYGGALARAAELQSEMDEAARVNAINAYFTAETTCSGRGETDIADSGEPDAPPATIDDVRASCRPAMAEVCACRARTLERAIGDGAFDVAVAINLGERARLERLADAREDGWADMAANAYARTSAPCIVQAGGR